MMLMFCRQSVQGLKVLSGIMASMDFQTIISLSKLIAQLGNRQVDIKYNVRNFTKLDPITISFPDLLQFILLKMFISIPILYQRST
jgi:hypothetical protein